jgi:hypothetical protein
LALIDPLIGQKTKARHSRRLKTNKEPSIGFRERHLRLGLVPLTSTALVGAAPRPFWWKRLNGKAIYCNVGMPSLTFVTISQISEPPPVFATC